VALPDKDEREAAQGGALLILGRPSGPDRYSQRPHHGAAPPGG
jgi:hypothetical protein